MLFCQVTWADKLETIVTVYDGLDFDSVDNISDDYIRLHLTAPSYKTMATIDKLITNWLGPDITRIESDTLILIQAPRNAHARIQFIAALLDLELPEEPDS